MVKIPVFAPTTTETWGFCHLKHELASIERWVPVQFGKRDLAPYLGRAFAAAMAALNFDKLPSRDASAPSPLSPTDAPPIVASRAFVGEIEALRAAGVQIMQDDVDESAAALGRGVEKYLANDPLIESNGWHVQDVELTLPNHGRARIDWGGLDPDGVLCQVDYKLKLNLDAKWYSKEVERYRYSNQMWHYCWGYGEHKQQPVNRYYVCLVVLSPRFSVKAHPYEVDPELLAAWRTSAEQKWRDMDAQKEGLRIPDMASVHRDAYGDCIYQRACLELKLDPALMSVAYVQLPRREHE